MLSLDNLTVLLNWLWRIFSSLRNLSWDVETNPRCTILRAKDRSWSWYESVEWSWKSEKIHERKVNKGAMLMIHRRTLSSSESWWSWVDWNTWNQIGYVIHPRRSLREEEEVQQGLERLHLSPTPARVFYFYGLDPSPIRSTPNASFFFGCLVSFNIGLQLLAHLISHVIPPLFHFVLAQLI